MIQKLDVDTITTTTSSYVERKRNFEEQIVQPNFLVTDPYIVILFQLFYITGSGRPFIHRSLKTNYLLQTPTSVYPNLIKTAPKTSCVLYFHRYIKT